MPIEPTLEWNGAALLQSPLFAPLYPLLEHLPAGQFPSLQDCNALLAAREPPIAVHSGALLRFVAQQSGKLVFEAQYEPRCYLKGEVPTRPNDWHDLFNALVWLTFPGAKAAINARHYRALADTGRADDGKASQRGAVRDMNTLLDESGVLVACADAGLAGLLRGFKWKELFWQRREQVRPQSSRQAMGFCLFGHSLYQKALRPYVGITGQGLLLAVEPGFFGWPAARQLAHLDRLLADYLADPQHCRSTRELCPVPLLGIPGWTPDNENPAYYDNTAYFRSGRRGWKISAS